MAALLTSNLYAQTSSAADPRVGPLKDLNGYFPFTPPRTAEAWSARAAWLRTRVQVSQGLLPFPTRTPLNAVIHSRVEGDGYSLEKVYFESLPGFYVTGMLYRPAGPGKYPAVLCPHGHFGEGRVELNTDTQVAQLLKEGAERLPGGAHSPIQSFGVQLARMGCVAFFWDMIGYGDSIQISQQTVHRFARDRPEMNTEKDWGLFSAQAEAHAQNVMGLHTWDSMRAFDFLSALPDVDATRVAMAGASAGATQTILCAALEPRLKVGFPSVMISTGMQGGCTCENASLLRVGTGNVELAALFAPKPLATTSANDWTRELPQKGFPDLQALYKTLGAPDNVAMWDLSQFPHNFNAVSREKIYRWLNDKLVLGLGEDRLVEREFSVLAKSQLSVWDQAHPAPKANDPDFERGLLRWWHEDAQKQMALSSRKPEEIRALTGKAWEVILGSPADETRPMRFSSQSRVSGDGYEEVRGVLREKTHGEEVAIVQWVPATAKKDGSASSVIWLDAHGAAGLVAENGAPRPEVRRLLDAGLRVIGLDLIFQSEMTGNHPVPTRKVDNPREAAGYTFCYNEALFAQRVHDLVNVIAWAGYGVSAKAKLGLVALDSTGPIAAGARAMASLDAAAIDTHGFRFASVLDWRSPDFLPAAAKYGDLPALLALGGQGTLWLRGEPSPAAEGDAVSWLLGAGQMTNDSGRGSSR